MRAVPDDDPTIAALADADRAFAARSWLGRAGAELDSTRGFSWIADACAQLGAGDDIVALARRAAADEARHAELCRRVASAYAGTDLPAPALSPPSTVPLRTPDDLELAVALYIVESCCLSETIGAVTLEATLAAATSPLAAAALRQLLADEVTHARLGWAYLGAPHLGGRHRAAIATWLPELVASMTAYWHALGAGPTPPAALGHGCLPLERLDDFLRVAFEDLALPGFEHVGIPVAAPGRRR